MPENKKVDPIEIGKWGLIIAGGFILYKTLKGLGLIKTGAAAQEEAQEEQAESTNLTIDEKEFTTINFWKKAPNGYRPTLIPMTGTDYLAKQIWDSYGSWYSDDNEEQMQGALRTLKAKTQYSWLADRFLTVYKEDLTLFLKEHFTPEELYPVWRHLENLPSGFVKK
jgi:hypothetical protein